MGAFLSEPVTDKVSADEEHERLSYGVCSMQGWRFTQEDNHSCCPSLDEKTSLFGVYDGHGGAEVSRYVADLLPEYVLQRECWKDGEFGKALAEAFLALDAHLGSKKGLKVLKKLAAEDDAALDKDKTKSSVDEDGDSDDSEENVKNLFKEAKMPLQALIAKYGKAMASLRNATESSEDEDKDAASGSTSPKASKAKDEAESGGSSGAAAAASGAKDEEEDKPKENGLPDEEDAPKNGSGERLQLRSRRNRIVYSDNDDDDDSSDEEYDENSSLIEEGMDGGEDEDEEEESSEADDDDDDDEDEDELEGGLATSDEFALNMLQGPGLDSGCTAVVAVLDDKGTLYVANAGDSRCIISRRGVAIDMSVDHKPEDEEESKRIVDAGGEVTTEGRVNGGLNLSRALGDHAYKQGSCGARKQMISALPDVRKIKLRKDEDEFLVLACDGIWNSMTSQDVVDFVRKRLYKTEAKDAIPGDLEGRRKLSEGVKLSEICGEMFDHCLAPNTSGDGTGCDNMTAILITFKEEMFKGRSDEEEVKEGEDIVLLTPPPSPELPKTEEDKEESSEEEEEEEEPEDEEEDEVEEKEEVKSTGKGCKRGLVSKDSGGKSKKAKLEEEEAKDEEKSCKRDLNESVVKTKKVKLEEEAPAAETS